MKKVLVLEDCPDIAEDLEEFLEALGLFVVLLDGPRPDEDYTAYRAAIVDEGLQGSFGHEVIPLIAEANPDICLIYIPGSPQREHAEKFSGILRHFSYQPKPFSLHRIRKDLEQWELI